MVWEMTGLMLFHFLARYADGATRSGKSGNSLMIIFNNIKFSICSSLLSFLIFLCLLFSTELLVTDTGIYDQGALMLFRTWE